MKQERKLMKMIQRREVTKLKMKVFENEKFKFSLNKKGFKEVEIENPKIKKKDLYKRISKEEQEFRI